MRFLLLKSPTSDIDVTCSYGGETRDYIYYPVIRLKGSTMVIRNYTPNDCALLAQLFYDTVHTVNAKDYTKEQLMVWASGTVDLEEWNRSFLEHTTRIAEFDGKIVGFADMDRHGYLDRLYVHKEFQSRGIATALVDELEQCARKEKVCCFTTYASITARPFFEKRGYRVLQENKVVRKGITLINYKMKK